PRGPLLGALLAVAPVDDQVLALDVSQFLKLFAKSLMFRQGPLVARQHADAAHPVSLLRLRRERRRGCVAEQRAELAPFHLRAHSITSSASESRLSEILTPSAFAVLRLITSSNLVGCKMGRSAGFSPLRIRPV